MEVECRYCKNKVKNNIKRCPYCGTINPTTNIKEIIITTIIIIAIMWFITYE